MEEIKQLYDALETSSTDDFLLVLEKQVDFYNYKKLQSYPTFIKNTVFVFCVLSMLVNKNSPYKKNFESNRFFFDCIDALYAIKALYLTLPLKGLDGFEEYYPFNMGSIAYDAPKHIAQLTELLKVDNVIYLLEEYIEKEKAHYCSTKKLLAFSGKTYRYKSIIIPMSKTFLSSKAVREAAECFERHVAVWLAVGTGYSAIRC